MERDAAHIPYVDSGSYPIRAGNRVRPLVDGDAAFRRICDTVEAARKSVWLTVAFLYRDFEMPDGRGSLFDVLDRAQHVQSGPVGRFLPMACRRAGLRAARAARQQERDSGCVNDRLAHRRTRFGGDGPCRRGAHRQSASESDGRFSRLSYSRKRTL